METTDAEQAFLETMSNTPANNGGAQETGDADEYDPAAVINDASYGAGQGSSRGTSSSGSMPQSPSTPENVGIDAAPSAPVEVPVKPQPAPRTVGGFVVDDDDEEEDDKPEVKVDTKAEESVESGNGAQVSADAAQRSISQTPINGVDVPVQKAQDQDHNGALTNGAAETISLPSVPANADAPLPSKSTPVQPVTDAPLKPVPAQATATASKARLPQDVVGRLEDRIEEDPRGDLDAWLTLIAEHRKRNKLDDARAVYERFFVVFPTAIEQWLAYANMEQQQEELTRLEMIFNASLPNNLCVQLWTMYLDYIRRRNNLANDADGSARTTVLATFKYILEKIGIDKDSGAIWEDWIEFLRSGPGKPEGTSWQDGQKRDEMRAAFQKAIAVPTRAVSSLWKQYDNFEMSINKLTGRKFLQEKMSTYVTARSAHTHLANITEHLDRYATPRLAPLKGFDGDEEFTRQVEIWGQWIQWEKDDPLVLKLDDAKAYKDRVLYVYRQAVMPLRFVPEIWFEAANWCYENGLGDEGDGFLTQGMIANPESCLLAFKRGERHELTANTDDTDAGKIKKGALVREPYDKVLGALYELLKKTKDRQAQLMANVQERLQQEPLELPDQDDDDIDEETLKEKAEKAREAMIKSQLEFISRGGEVQTKSLKRTITHVWINLMRAMRRVQGKGSGKSGDDELKPGGFRAIFQEGRKRGNTTCEFWLAIAGLEHHYQEPVAGRLFERAAKLYPDDPLFQLSYIKFLISVNDVTNARAAFATAVGKMIAVPEKLALSKPLFAFFHEFESRFGELSQIIELEKRMATLFPEDPLLGNFSRRYQEFDFDATSVKHIISQTAQARPRALVPPPTVAVTAPEVAPPSVQDSPRPSVIQPTIQVTNSPKRPLPLDESDMERPSKIARGGSPLKGAAGRRMAGTSRVQDNTVPTNNLALSHTHPVPPPPNLLPKDITYLLSIIPPAYTYNITRLDPRKMVELLDNTDLTRSQHWRQPLPPMPPQIAHLGGTPQMGYPQMFPPPPGPQYGYPR